MTMPRDDGFFMPAEWTPHRRCWMAWPCSEAVWGEHLGAAREAYAEIAVAIARFEPVTMIVRPDLTASVSLLGGTGVSLLPLAHDDSWTRDTGPTFLVDGKGTLAGADWRFNGWGEVHPDYAQDAQMARRVLEHVGAARYEALFVLEGGAIHVDGEGTCLVCETALLDPRRNPGMSRDEFETHLKAWLGVEVVIWLPQGLVDDETNGHIDNVACFARPGVVLLHTTEDTSDANYPIVQRNLETLKAATDAKGRALEIIALPQPKTRTRSDGSRMTTSYVNFYICNGGIVMPGFGDAADAVAYRTLAAAFPGREVVQIDALDVLQGGGGIHCITQQQPDA